LSEIPEEPLPKKTKGGGGQSTAAKAKAKARVTAMKEHPAFRVQQIAEIAITKFDAYVLQASTVIASRTPPHPTHLRSLFPWGGMHGPAAQYKLQTVFPCTYMRARRCGDSTGHRCGSINKQHNTKNLRTTRQDMHSRMFRSVRRSS
jgi:hypothetical protein